VRVAAPTLVRPLYRASVTDSLFSGLGVKRFSHLLIEGVAFAFGREAFVFRLNVDFAFLLYFYDLLLQIGAFVTGFSDSLLQLVAIQFL
jgi:hypothetical protein